MKNELKFDRKRTTAKKCPCGKNNNDGKFAPYVGFVDCGFCHSCGTNFLPPIDKDENFLRNRIDPIQQSKKQKSVSFIPVDIFKASLIQDKENNFIKFLLDRFGAEITTKQIEKYFIGSSKHWSGATVFWQIDERGKIRTGKVMLYNAPDGKRIKQPYNHVTWVHKAVKLDEFELKQCLFGQHLLNSSSKTIAIVESEKTAIISSIYLPQFEWLAVGSKTNLSLDRLTALKGRKVVLFPDLNCFDLWKAKADEFSGKLNISVSELLEKKASEQERNDGLDLADYLLSIDFQDFIGICSRARKYQSESSCVQIDEVASEKEKLIKEAFKNAKDQSIEYLLQVSINKCLYQSKSKSFTDADYTFFVNEHFRTSSKQTNPNS